MKNQARAWCAVLVAASAVAVARPAPAEAPLIPREILFASPEKAAPKLSPDGTRLSYLGPSKKGVLNIFVRTIGKSDDRQVTNDEHRGIFSYDWAPDASLLLYVQDRDGDENWHLYATDLGTGETRDLTPFPDVRADNLIVDPAHAKSVLVGLNQRDPRVLDMHRVNLETGEVTLEAENPGDVVEWVADHDFVIRAQAAIDADARSIIRVRDSATAPWRVLQSWSFAESPFDRFQRLVGFSPDGKELLVQSARGSNTTRIVAVNLASGKETEAVPADSSHDLFNYTDGVLAYMPLALVRHPETGAIQAYAIEEMKPRWKVVDPSLQKDFDLLAERFGESNFVIHGRDAKDGRWLVEHESDVHPGTYYVYDRSSGSFELLFHNRPKLQPFPLAEKRVVRYRASDGLEIPAFLTLPRDVEARSLPLIVLPHGGPWHRDGWGFDIESQWLANRGYAVLQPQFRGSTGFGKRYVVASTGEIGPGKMLQDLTDGVQWAIGEGIADPKRIGIMGGSYGGYAVLCGLTFTPEIYACGVDVVGPSNMKTLFQSFPPYWAPRLKRWTNYVGNVIEDEELNKRISPLFHVSNIRAPLLIGHGANDVRVKVEESDRVVAAMRDNERQVTYVVYPDEGHGFARPPNQEDFNGRVEEFLAKYLRGRSEPWKQVAGTTAEVR
jgi:dipeptidyl aminopeptidase/acylaminoacyl peptidase